MIEAGRDCMNPICGCGCCDDPEEPEKNCPFSICMCGCCTDEEEDEDDTDDC